MTNNQPLDTSPDNAAEDFIVFEDVHKSFKTNAGELKVLQGVNLTIQRGETVVIIGQSGTGKSVALRCLLGLLKPDSGRVLYRGQNICAMNEVELVGLRNHFGMLFQMAALFDSLTVGENIGFGLEAQGLVNAEEQERIVKGLLKAVDLTEHGFADKMPSDISGGQKKRVGLARALATKPEVVLYDEPTTGLDPITAAMIDRLIRTTQDENEVTGVVVTHDMKSAHTVGDRIIMLHEGKVIGDAPPDAILGLGELTEEEAGRRCRNDRIIRQFVRGDAHGPIEKEVGA